MDSSDQSVIFCAERYLIPILVFVSPLLNTYVKLFVCSGLPTLWNDMYADAVLAIVLRVDTDPQARKISVQRITKPDLYREFRDRLEVLTLFNRCVVNSF